KTPDAKLQMKMLLKTAAGKIGQRVFARISPAQAEKLIGKDTVVIDGVFGTGFRIDPHAAGSRKNRQGGAVEKLSKLFEAAGSAGFVLSIDVPSGVDADTGEAESYAIVSDCTVTFTVPKLGLYVSPGSLYSGDVVVKGLFVPRTEIKTNYEFVDEDTAKNIARDLKRKPNSHKGSYGHVAVISSAKGMEGAVAMSGMAALRAGAGLLSVIAVGEKEESLRKRMPMLASEAMIKEYDSKALSKFSVVIVGPGFGKQRKKELKSILKRTKCPMVIDADALNLIAENKSFIKIIKNKNVVLTPHPGEMSRLTGEKDVQAHRLRTLEKFIKGRKFSVLFKGYRSMLGVEQGAGTRGGIFINSSGNPALSKGGSGDVLSGIIAAFIAQGIKPADAGVLGAYVHGLCADRLVKKKKVSSLGLMPTDVIKELGAVLKCLTE
ncbi:MAG: NAD(P)H-hydrate dehydratase, partial [Pseudomonadota bacterium]